MRHDKIEKRARVLIVDDHPAVRRGPRDADRTVFGPGSLRRGRGLLGEALRLVAETRPDVAVIGISLKTGCGLDLIKRIKDRNGTVRMQVWSTYSESLYAERALRAGALGYINKDQATDKIVEGASGAGSGKPHLLK